MTAAEVRMLGSMLGWRLALPGLKRVLPLPRLVRLVGAVEHRDGGAPGTTVSAVVTAVRRLYRPRIPGADNCLERSLLAYRYLLRAGASPELVCGVDRTAQGVVGHAWVMVDGSPVTDRPEAVERFTPVVRFGPDGSR